MESWEKDRFEKIIKSDFYPRFITPHYVLEGRGPFPGVIDMFGTAGGNIEFRAALLASRGYATLALAYMLYEDLPLKITEVNFEYFIVS